jgi:phosphoglycerate kinase
VHAAPEGSQPGALAPASRLGLPRLEDLERALGGVRGRKVLVRADLNVPLERRNGEVLVADDFRIRATLPTLGWLLTRGARIRVASHLGRPRGRVDPALSLAPVAERLEALFAEEGWGPTVALVGLDALGGDAGAPSNNLPNDLPNNLSNNVVELVENLRFDPGEERGDSALARRLLVRCEAYVNDAFGSSHRAHASIVGPPRLVPSAAGRLLAAEVEALERLRREPARPFVALLGGAKVEDKLGLVRALLDLADRVGIGGGMAFTFLKAAGRSVGDSLVDAARIADCATLLEQAGQRIVLPEDLLALSPDDARLEVTTEVPEGWRGMDIGPRTQRRFSGLIAAAKSVFWNGPMGVVEDERFREGTACVARAIADSDAYSVVGGGDSAAVLRRLGLDGKVGFVSTGGGASLEFLERGTLPGIEALRMGRTGR